MLIQCSYTAGARLISASYTSRYWYEPAWSIYPQDVAAESGKVIKKGEFKNKKKKKKKRKKERAQNISVRKRKREMKTEEIARATKTELLGPQRLS